MSTANASIQATFFIDPGCPWGYSATPALRTLEWRYGAQIAWKMRLIGLTESAQEYADKGFTAKTFSGMTPGFKRFGMPLAPRTKRALSSTAPACRAIIAAGQQGNDFQWKALRALQFAQFTTPALMEDLNDLATALKTIDGLDVDGVIAAIDSDPVVSLYEEDRAAARRASGTAGSLQGKTTFSGDQERFTAPSIVFTKDDFNWDATGFQPVEAYDVLIANLDPRLERRAAAKTPLDAIDGMRNSFAGNGLTTQEIVAIMTKGNDAVDRVAVERELLGLVTEGTITQTPLGNDALWHAV